MGVRIRRTTRTRITSRLVNRAKQQGLFHAASHFDQKYYLATLLLYGKITIKQQERDDFDVLRSFTEKSTAQ